MTDRLSCFVIMPYSEESDKFYEEGIAPVLQKMSRPVLALRADTMGRQAITLRAHVETAVRSADFCIADLTGNNPNVMYELGYAVAVDRPIVLIRRRGLGLLPSNLAAEKVVIEYDPNNISEFRRRLASTIEDTVISISRSVRSVISEKKSEVYLSSFDNDLIDRILNSIDKRFFSLVSSPRLLAEKLLPGLRSRIGSGMLIRIVAADPESEFSRLRSMSSGISAARYRSEMWRGLSALQKQAPDLRIAHTELRIANEIVPNALYITDDLVIVAPYLASDQSHEAVTFLVSKKVSAKSYDLFLQEFNRAWESGRIISEPNLSPPPRGNDADEEI